MNVICVLDVALMATIALCAGDVLRQVRPREQPWRAMAFALVALGALGWIDALIRGQRVSWFTLALHLGFAVLAVLHLHARNLTARRPQGLPDRRHTAWP